MIPLRVYVNGFLSYRGEETFDFRERKLWMLSGKNGAGKSAVFDAITFALFREHRGGGSNAGDLINWHRDEFEVKFDFSVGGETYRAERKIRKNGTPAAERLLSRWDGATWMPLERANLESDFQAHARRILGMDYETFCVSVLLRQGKVDRLLEVKPSDRFDILSQIVDLSAYETLRQRADQRRRLRKIQADDTATELVKVPEVSAEQIAAQEIVAKNAKEAADAAQKWVTELAGLVVLAGQWEGLEKKRTDAKTAVENAAALIADEATIRRNADRLADLNAVLPLLAELFRARGEHAQAEADLQAAQNTLDQRCAALAPVLHWDVAVAKADSDSLLRAIQADVDAIADLKTALPSLKRFAQQRSLARTALAEHDRLLASPVAEPAPLETACANEIRALSEAETILTAQNTTATVAEQTHKDAQERLQRFQQAGDATECRFCGQSLSPERRASMEADLTRERDDCKAKHDEAAEAATQAQATRDAADTALAEAKKAWQQACTNADDYQKDVEKQANNYAAAHREAVAACAELPKELAERIVPRPLVDAPDQTAWAGQSAAGDTFPTEADLTNLKKRTGALEARRKQHQTLQEAINEVAQKRTLPQERRRSVERAEQAIPAAWTALATPEFLSENALGLLRHEQENLKGADERARDLDEATRGLNALRDRLHEIIADIEKMPNEACRPAQEVRAEQTKAESERDKANSEARAAQNETEQLRKQREEHDILAKKRDDARRDEGLYKTLTELLGPDKLQSYLLRGAEEAIVEHANEALTAFSGGTLRLARRAESDAVDQASATGVTGDKKRKALDLLCSNTETADAPLPLHNLSGSQKFRVAVALALGIGQFASASDARIQSVIIDEGFGSLDPQNQSDMARELRGLADRLERIIVVSHQETFADGFDDRIHVTLGEEGSRAEPLLA